MVQVEILHQRGKKVRNLWRLILTFSEVTDDKLIDGKWGEALFATPPPTPPHILNVIKNQKAKCEVGSSYKDCSQFHMIYFH